MKTWIANLMDEELMSQAMLHETNEEFIQRICSLCLDEIESRKGYSPVGFGVDVILEIEQEVAEIFRIKTYGYYNLVDYKTKQLKKRIS